MSNKIEAEYNDIVNRNAWSTVYQSICKKCEKYEYTYEEAKRPSNTCLNRYMDVSPYDHSRVLLQRHQHDYINANIVTMARAKRRYILTQGPLASTAGHFWLMVWEQNCGAIVMLNKLVEKNRVKCHWYWPCQEGAHCAMVLGDVGLSVEHISTQEYPHYTLRHFKLTDVSSSSSREILHFQYNTWPDFGVPSSPLAFLQFLRQVRASGCLDGAMGPPVVHCSAGIGRSGTFCLVDSCLVLIEQEGCESVDVQEILLEMRKERMGLIQTPDQLRFTYQAIIEGIRRLDPNHQCEEVSEEAVVAGEEGDEPPPPPPPKRGDSLRKAPPLPTQDTPTTLHNGTTHTTAQRDTTSSSLAPPTKELPKAPTDSESDNSEGDGEVSGGLRRRAVQQAALREKVQQMKRKQETSEHWASLKRSLYKPLALSFGLLLCGALVYYYVRH